MWAFRAPPDSVSRVRSKIANRFLEIKRMTGEPHHDIASQRAALRAASGLYAHRTDDRAGDYRRCRCLCHSRLSRLSRPQPGGEGLALAASARLAVAENAASGVSLDGGFDSPPSTRNVESIKISSENGQIVIAYTPRVAPAGSNILALVPSVPDDPAAPTARIALQPGTLQSGTLTWECFAADKTDSSLPAPGPGPSPAEKTTLLPRFAPPECRKT